ncbi:hypothetical protein D3C81_305090 [compost metagenome]
MSEKEVAYVPHWLKNGEKDPFPDYLQRDRSDLPMADFSDDALGNYLFMNYDRTVDQDVAIMMMIGRGEETEHVTRVMMATSIKERLRWLSRQLLAAEGKYPGTEKPVQIDAEKVWRYLVDNDLYVATRPDYLRARAIELLPEDYVDEKMQPILRELIEKKYIDEDGNELSLLKSRMGLTAERYTHRMPPTKTEREAAEHKARVEERAEQIYSSWHMRAGFSPWVPGGNSDHQVEARRQAIGQLSKEQEEPKDA